MTNLTRFILFFDIHRVLHHCWCLCIDLVTSLLCNCESVWLVSKQDGVCVCVSEEEEETKRTCPAPARLRQWCGSPGSLGVRDSRQGICLMSWWAALNLWTRGEGEMITCGRGEDSSCFCRLFLVGMPPLNSFSPHRGKAFSLASLLALWCPNREAMIALTQGWNRHSFKGEETFYFLSVIYTLIRDH